MKKIFIAAILVSFCFIGFAQKNVQFRINHKLANETFAMDKAARNNMGVNFKVNRLEYYISEISVVHDGGTETPIKDFWILENAGTQKIHDLGQINLTSVDSIKFSIGVNQEVNHADPAKYAIGHPLAPKSPSMHWGWASGYRFVAIEGKAGLDLNKTFEIHALGDPYYFSQSIPVSGRDTNGNILIEVNADYTKGVQNIDVSKNVITHGDFDEAITLLRNFWADVFTSVSGAKNTLDVEVVEKEVEVAEVYPNPIQVNEQFSVVSPAGVAKIVVSDYTGKVVNEIVEVAGKTVDLSLENSGLYYLHFYNSSGQKIQLLKQIVL